MYSPRGDRRMIHATDYRWDVFVSYKREPLTAHWMAEVVQRVTYWLGEELQGAGARVFFDVSAIEVGDRWPHALRQAVLTSRCLLPILSPAYFRSRYCLA